MLRSLFCVWFTIFSLFGPVLCCCILKPLAAAEPLNFSSEATPEAEPVDECPFCKAEKAKTTHPAKPQPFPPKESPIKCPCQGQITQVDLNIPPANSSAELSWNLSQWDGVWVYLVQNPTTENLTPLDFAFERPPWPMALRDSLALLQILRC